MRLSILTCHLPFRKLMLMQLAQCLEPQLTTEVEFLVDAGEGTTGAKRNRLLEQSKGDYIAFVDDDDLVSQKYVAYILKAIETNPDCVGIRGVLQDDGRVQGIFEHSLKHTDWKSGDGGDVKWLRPPNHLNPIRREHAIKAGFTDKTIGEDFDYSMAVRKYLKSEVFIDEPIYLYQHHIK